MLSKPIDEFIRRFQLTFHSAHFADQDTVVVRVCAAALDRYAVARDRDLARILVGNAFDEIPILNTLHLIAGTILTSEVQVNLTKKAGRALVPQPRQGCRFRVYQGGVILSRLAF